jgi:hypothetical protein
MSIFKYTTQDIVNLINEHYQKQNKYYLIPDIKYETKKYLTNHPYRLLNVEKRKNILYFTEAIKDSCIKHIDLSNYYFDTKEYLEIQKKEYELTKLKDSGVNYRNTIYVKLNNIINYLNKINNTTLDYEQCKIKIDNNNELEAFYYREYPSTKLDKYYPLTKLDIIKTIIEN